MLHAAPPPRAAVDTFGQPSRSAEVAGRPLGATLHLFRFGKTVTIPTWHGGTLAGVAARMRAGTLVQAKARAVEWGFVVPTATGGVCAEAQVFLTCHRGLLPQGVTYSFQYSGVALVVFGIVSDDVARVSLGGLTVAVRDNVFLLSRPMKLASTAHPPKTFGTLVVSYRGKRASARVPIR